MTSGPGYEDSDGAWMHGEADLAAPGGQFSEVLNKGLRGVKNAVRTIVLRTIADDPSIAAAAAALAQSSAGLVKKTDPGIPAEIPTTSAADAGLIDSLGRVSRSMRPDGSTYVHTLQIGGSEVIDGLESDNTGWTAYIDEAGRLPEFYLDPFGRIAASSIAVLKNRLAGSGDPIRMLIEMGQSKAQGFAQYPVPMFGGDPRVVKWDAGSASWVTHPAQRTETLGWAAARRYARDLLPPGSKVGVVSAAAGSTGFSSTSLTPAPSGYHTVPNGTWDRALVADPKNLALAAVAQAQAALAAAPPGSTIVGVLWSQMEEDRAAENDAPGWWGAKFDDFASYVRTALGLPALPFIVGSMTSETEAQPVSYKGADALRDTPRRLQNVAYVEGPIGMSDSAGPIHYSAPGEAEYGYSFADALPGAINAVPTCPPVPPQRVRIERSGGIATIRWSPPPGRQTRFRLEVSVNSGAAWTQPELTAPLALQHVLAVAAGTPLWVRLQTINEAGTSVYSREVHG